MLTAIEIEPTATDTHRAPTDSLAQWQGVVAQLATMVHTWRTIRDTHTRTSDGYCGAKVCGMPGYGSPFLAHPCVVLVAATAAADLYRSSC